jgi:hypothetical protein
LEHVLIFSNGEEAIGSVSFANFFFNWWPMNNYYEFLFYSSRGITHSTKILRSSRKADTVQIIWCPTLLRSH